jgi:hypothetical protein
VGAGTRTGGLRSSGKSSVSNCAGPQRAY